MRTAHIGISVARLATALFATSHAAAQAPVFHWETDLEAAAEKAARSGKPMLVGFR